MWYTYVGFILTTFAAGVYIWAVLKWNDVREEATDKTAFRAWKINFTSFWASVGATVINIAFSWAFRSILTTNFL